MNVQQLLEVLRALPRDAQVIHQSTGGIIEPVESECIVLHAEASRFIAANTVVIR